MSDQKIVAFMNAYTQGNSGGDACFIEIAKRVGEYKKIVVTSSLGKQLCQSKGLQAEFLITTSEKFFSNVIFTYLVRLLRALFLRIELNKGDIIYGTSDFLPDVLPALLQKMRGKNGKWVQKIYHLIPAKRIIPYLAQRISFFFIRRYADVIIIDNSFLKQDLIESDFNGNKIFVNHLGTDLKYFQEIKKDPKALYDAVFLGRMHASKGIFDIIKIAKSIILQKPEFKMAVIGGGNHKIAEIFKEQIKKEGLDKNIFTLGYLEDEEAFSILKNSIVFLFPSHEEGFGIAAVEAMACGLPVIAWNLPVFKEVFPLGMIQLPIGEISLFAEAVLKLLDNDEFYSALSAEAEKHVQNFDWSIVARRELRFMEQ